MASRHAVKSIWICVCGHSRAAHDTGKLKGCGFCGCYKFIPDHLYQELIPAGDERAPGTEASPIPPLRQSKPAQRSPRTHEPS